MNIKVTAKQKEFFDYAMKYYNTNGALPTPSQAGRDLNINHVHALTYYSALFLRGAFSGGNKPVAGNKERKGDVTIKAVNAGELRIQPRGSLRKRRSDRDIVNTLDRLVASGDPAAKKLATALGL